MQSMSKTLISKASLRERVEYKLHSEKELDRNTNLYPKDTIFRLMETLDRRDTFNNFSSVYSVPHDLEQLFAKGMSSYSADQKKQLAMTLFSCIDIENTLYSQSSAKQLYHHGLISFYPYAIAKSYDGFEKMENGHLLSTKLTPNQLMFSMAKNISNANKDEIPLDEGVKIIANSLKNDICILLDHDNALVKNTINEATDKYVEDVIKQTLQRSFDEKEFSVLKAKLISSGMYGDEQIKYILQTIESIEFPNNNNFVELVKKVVATYSGDDLGKYQKDLLIESLLKCYGVSDSVLSQWSIVDLYDYGFISKSTYTILQKSMFTDLGSDLTKDMQLRWFTDPIKEIMSNKPIWVDRNDWRSFSDDIENLRNHDNAILSTITY